MSIKSIPKEHAYMVITVTLITLYAMYQYATVPVDRKDFFQNVGLGGLFFLTGKFTNGFNIGNKRNNAER